MIAAWVGPAVNDWRMPFTVIAAPSLLCSILMLFIVKEPPRGEWGQSGSTWDGCRGNRPYVLLLLHSDGSQHQLKGSTRVGHRKRRGEDGGEEGVRVTLHLLCAGLTLVLPCPAPGNQVCVRRRCRTLQARWCTVSASPGPR